MSVLTIKPHDCVIYPSIENRKDFKGTHGHILETDSDNDSEIENENENGGPELGTIRSSYPIHDNGGRPFEVKINLIDGVGTVELYHRDYGDEDTDTDASDSDDDNLKYTAIQLMTFKVNQVFVGKSYYHEDGFPDGYGSKFDGNSILLLLENQKDYVMITDTVKIFQTESPIVEFFSPVGRNDVPYPYAIDARGYYYNLSDYTGLVLSPDHISNKDKPYEFGFYNYGKITGFKGITELYIGTDKFHWAFHIDMEEHFDRMAGNPERSIISVRQNGELREISKDEYIAIQSEWLMSQKGIATIDMTEIIPRFVERSWVEEFITKNVATSVED